ncbi:MAG: hypothetical protein JWP08_3789 [Bryobacterales bacterium]|jgi:hypothetical protein|nr:hypothetical protein [Bryobacterales bacterium]
MPNPFQIEPQKKLNWCWAAVAATVSNYFFPGLALDQCGIAKNVLRSNADCCGAAAVQCDRTAPLEDALAAVNTMLNKNLNCQVLGRFLKFGEIRTQIDAGRPVCARIQWIGEQRAHFVMISGYSVSHSGEQWVDVADPYWGNSILPYPQFVSSYRHAGEWSDSYLLDRP